MLLFIIFCIEKKKYPFSTGKLSSAASHGLKHLSKYKERQGELKADRRPASAKAAPPFIGPQVGFFLGKVL